MAGAELTLEFVKIVGNVYPPAPPGICTFATLFYWYSKGTVRGIAQRITNVFVIEVMKKVHETS